MDWFVLVLVLVLSALAVAPTTATSSCATGERPSYYVPGGAARPIAIIGCVRLGVSGKPVELSADSERIGGKDHLCLNPAYRGRGQLGIYIPARCTLPSRLRELRVLDVDVPRQAVRGYEVVIWGTVPPSTSELVAHHQGGRARGAVLRVPRALASKTGASAAFSAFVVQLPIAAACHPIRLRAVTAPRRSGGRSRHRPRPGTGAGARRRSVRRSRSWSRPGAGRCTPGTAPR